MVVKTSCLAARESIRQDTHCFTKPARTNPPKNIPKLITRPKSLRVNAARPNEWMLGERMGFFKIDHEYVDPPITQRTANEVAHVSIIVGEPRIDGNHREQIGRIVDTL